MNLTITNQNKNKQDHFLLLWSSCKNHHVQKLGDGYNDLWMHSHSSKFYQAQAQLRNF